MEDESTTKTVRLPVGMYRAAGAIATAQTAETGVEVTTMAVVRAALAKGLEQLEKGAE